MTKERENSRVPLHKGQGIFKNGKKYLDGVKSKQGKGVEKIIPSGNLKFYYFSMLSGCSNDDMNNHSVCQGCKRG